MAEVASNGGKALDLTDYPFIFMRWKERFFINVRSFSSPSLHLWNVSLPFSPPRGMVPSVYPPPRGSLEALK